MERSRLNFCSIFSSSIDQYWLQLRIFYGILTENIDRYIGQSVSLHPMEQNSCCFLIGHHDANESIAEILRNTVERHIVTDGVKDFLIGNYGAFDRISTRILVEAKRRHPDVRITLLLPYHPSLRRIELPSEFDGSIYPFDSRVPPKAAIVQANRWAIRRCDYLICYVCHFGNARKLLEFARRRETRGLIHVTNLGEK